MNGNAVKADSALKQEGMRLLISKLGYVDAERFVMLMSREPFDYTKWRDEHLDGGDSVRQLSSDAMRYSMGLAKPKTPSA